MATDVQSVIEQAVKAALEPITVQAVEVISGYNHADEEALFVTIILPPSTPPVEGGKYLAAIMQASEALLGVGDRRFPYIKFDHAGEESAGESDSFQAPPT